jgi:hypothetical protein
MPGRTFTSPIKYRYGFNGQESDFEIFNSGGSAYTAEFWEYDSRLGRRWNVDPAFKAKPWMSPYHAFSNKPIWNIDPNGANDDEYDKDGKKISPLGGDKIDFYHQANGDTKVEDQETCEATTISGGEKIIRGFTERDKDVNPLTIAAEWDIGIGPTKSIFTDFNGNSASGPFQSLHSFLSYYSSPARSAAEVSKEKKGMITMTYKTANPFMARDLWEQMWGRSNVSWYKLGDKVMFVMADSKSAKSFFYRLSPSWERSTLKVRGNTYQTYIWIENASDVLNKVNKKNDYELGRPNDYIPPFDKNLIMKK